MARIVVLSDIHLSPTHGFFWQNWCVARDFANMLDPDAAEGIDAFLGKRRPNWR